MNSDIMSNTVREMQKIYGIPGHFHSVILDCIQTQKNELMNDIVLKAIDEKIDMILISSFFYNYLYTSKMIEGIVDEKLGGKK